METYSIQTANYDIRNETFEGREHIVVPVVMMVEGVHAGSSGPLLHLASDLGKCVPAWNGIPITIEHPHQQGKEVQANTPAMLQQFAIGKVFHTRMDGVKLKAEAWFDVQRTVAVAPGLIDHINEHKIINVSVGVFNEIEEVIPTTHNGVQYKKIARNHRPDHLAILPDSDGACDWSKGCGIRNNKLKTKLNKNEVKENDEQVKKVKELVRLGLSVFVSSLTNNEQGLLALLNKMQTKLDAMDNDLSYYSLEELYDNHLIYRVRNRNIGVTTLYKQNYTTGSDDSIEFTGNPSRVRREVNYVQVTNKDGQNNNLKIDNNMAEEKKVCCEEKVDALIANKLSKFTVDDKSWLITLSAEELARVETTLTNNSTPTIKEVEKVVEKEVEVDMSIYVAKKDIDTVDGYLKFAPKEIQDSIRAGLNLNAQHRTALITHILANTKDVWTEDVLKEHDTLMLETLASQFEVKMEAPASYGGLGAGSISKVSTNGEDTMFPGSIDATEKKEAK